MGARCPLELDAHGLEARVVLPDPAPAARARPARGTSPPCRGRRHPANALRAANPWRLPPQHQRVSIVFAAMSLLVSVSGIEGVHQGTPSRQGSEDQAPDSKRLALDGPKTHAPEPRSVHRLRHPFLSAPPAALRAEGTAPPSSASPLHCSSSRGCCSEHRPASSPTKSTTRAGPSGPGQRAGSITARGIRGGPTRRRVVNVREDPQTSCARAHPTHRRSLSSASEPAPQRSTTAIEERRVRPPAPPPTPSSPRPSSEDAAATNDQHNSFQIQQQQTLAPTCADQTGPPIAI
jgi:hypothetical protein